MATGSYKTMGNPNFGPPGIWHTPAYQASGFPWITGSIIEQNKIQKMQFPHVPKSFTVINTGSSDTDYIRVSFQSGSGTTAITANGDSGVQNYNATSDVNTGFHYVRIAGKSGSFTFNVKAKEVFIACPGAQTGYLVVAELTSIPSTRMWHLTGSGITDPS